MQNDRFGLPPETLDRIVLILRKFDKIQDALIFGSRAKGTARTGSDIDIALKGHAMNSADIIAHINRVGVSLFMGIK